MEQSHTQDFSTPTMRITSHGVCQYSTATSILGLSLTNSGRRSYDYFSSSQALIVLFLVIIYLTPTTHLRCHVPPHTAVRLPGLAMPNREARMHRPSPGTPSGDLAILSLSSLYDSFFSPSPSLSISFCQNPTLTHQTLDANPRSKAYVGSDHPRTWDIGYLPPIRINIEPTKHYQLSGHNADAEWGVALAPHDGILHLGPRRQPYSISLFHQLRCLDIIRRDIVNDDDDDDGSSLPHEDQDHLDSKFKLSRHCLNYMRQMVLCRADLALDPVLGRALEARVRPDTNLCVDWRRVYEELEKNQREYAHWRATATAE